MNKTRQRLLEQSLNILRDYKNGASIAFLMRKYKFSRPILLEFLKDKKGNG
jgi:hypothetical protein